MAAIVAPTALARPVRGKDRGKLMEQLGDWHAPIPVGEFEGGHKLLYLPHHRDQALLGALMHHCSGTHYVWAEEERLWYFFALVDKNGVPVGTLHTKEEKWLNKVHPRDNSGKRIPFAIASSNMGLYATKEDVLAAFKRNNVKYEPGVYQPVSGMHSRYYDIDPRNAYDGATRFETRFPLYIQKRPDGVDPADFNEFMRCYKAMADKWNKTHGNVKIVGRTFYFDGKKQIVLSFSGGAQVGVKTTGRQMIFEWLNQHQRKDKALDIAVV